MTATITDWDEDNFPVDDDLIQTTVDNTIREILYAWQDNGLSGSHPNLATGVFYTNGVPSGLSGDTFVYSIGGQNSSVTVTGNLTYQFTPGVPASETHILYGSISSVTIGAGTDAGGNITSPAVTFSFSTPIVGTEAEGRGNDVHDVVWGLMNGSVDGATDSIGTPTQGGLIHALEENGLDVDQVFADAVGLSPLSESELLLAA
jgi:heme acquisition protein HasA